MDIFLDKQHLKKKNQLRYDKKLVFLKKPFPISIFTETLRCNDYK